jgi:beta-lactamase class A
LLAPRPVLVAQTQTSNKIVEPALLLIAGNSPSESALQKKIREIASEARGKVSVACSLPKSSLNCDLDPHAHPPMQSVFKFPLAVAILHEVELGKLSLDQPVRFHPEDRIPHAYSPLQDKYPEAGVNVPLRELLRMTVSLSDNVAADILLGLAHGPDAVRDYIASLGVAGFHLQRASAHCIRMCPCNTGTGLSRQGRFNSCAESAMTRPSPEIIRSCF